MSRKGKKRQQAKAKRPPKEQFSLGRYYRHYRGTFHQIFKWAGIVAGAIVIVVLAVVLIKKSGITKTKADHLRDARRDFVLGYPDRAVLGYHQAENSDPSDTRIKTETAMARAWADMIRDGQMDGPLSSALNVLANDSTVAVAHVGLAQLYGRAGDLKQTFSHAYSALKFASVESDTPSALAACLVLESSYRQKDMLDSAVLYSEQAVDFAHVVGDPTNLLLAESGAGFGTLRQGKLEKGRLLFEDILARAGSGGSALGNLGKLGMAEYFIRAGKPDSAVAIALDAVSALSNAVGSEVLALANHVLGRALREQGDLTGAASSLTTSLAGWATLRRQAELIDNLNDLAQTCQAQKDYFNSRKYLYAAAKLASKYGFDKKDHYDADMNVRFLSHLTQDEYVRAGIEGDVLIKQYSLW